MLTIQGAISYGAGVLLAENSASPILDARLLLQHVLGYSLETLLLNNRLILDAEVFAQFELLIRSISKSRRLNYKISVSTLSMQ